MLPKQSTAGHLQSHDLSVPSQGLAHRLRSTACRLTLGSVIGALLVWAALRGIDTGSLGQTIARVDLALVALALASVTATVLAGALRWRVLLAHGGPAPRWRAVASAILIGQMMNILLPVRVGEIARVSLIVRDGAGPVARVIATIAVEKVADGLMFGLAALALLFLLALPPWAVQSSHVVVTTGFALGAAAIIGVWARPVLRWVGGRLARPGRRPLARIWELVERAVEVFAVFADWRAALPLALLSAAILLLSAATNYILFRAFDLPLGPAAALFLLIVLQVGTASVPTPGSLGVFHYLAVLSLSAFAVQREVALAYAIVLYVVALGPKVLLGILIVAGLSLPARSCNPVHTTRP